MNDSIAIVGMACRYPDAASPAELWENVLAQRRSFRRIPSERLSLADYYSPDHNDPDKTYCVEAALIEDYEFDRVAFRVVGSTYRSADMVHWLALDIASRALVDAGFGDGDGLPRDTTGVVLGNTLTGEFSRANTIRLRWPYVRRVVEAKLLEQGWPIEQRRTFLNELEDLYKQPFPPVGEETLSGSLSNTIAGRLCNHFDLKGGGYTVDGACASSLLSVITACTSLMNGDLDVALAGGVDLSLDPFELVGFAKTGALAPDEMRVYDERSAGFWPGEGCGFVVLMRHADAVAQDRRIYAAIAGWGVASDGRGGITRPSVDGQLLALDRAYQRAGFGIYTVDYFEGHGTGTRVGDATELQALTQARRDAAREAPPAVIGSIKANIGHTKAAAGIAGLLKATMAVHSRILPPTTGCDRPQRLLRDATSPLKVLAKGEPWPGDRPCRTGVSAMGFGGINTHVVVQGAAEARRPSLNRRERVLLGSAQDAELLLFGAPDHAALIGQVDRVLAYAARLSRSEMGDLAAELLRTLTDRQVRAALVVSSPSQLAEHLTLLRDWLDEGAHARLDMSTGLFLGAGEGKPRIGFVFPGQGSPVCRDAGTLGRRFEPAAALYDGLKLPDAEDDRSTAIAQPAIVTSSMAALRVLRKLGVEASAAVGHSLGELTALHWAGAFGEAALLRIALGRGAAMARLGDHSGAMASLVATPSEVEEMIGAEPVVIAGLNTPRRTVISGDARAVSRVVDRARAAGRRALMLPVSHAFHSPAVGEVAPVLAEHLAREAFEPLQRPVISTVTGGVLEAETDLRQLLCDQVISPVRFSDAASIIMEQTDLLIEMGPGQVLTGMLEDMEAATVVAVDVGGHSLKGLLRAIGAAYALGTPLDCGALFESRFSRSFNLDWNRKFFINPCELAPVRGHGRVTDSHERAAPVHDVSEPAAEMETSESPLDLFRRLVADRAELPPTSVQNDDRLLSDLHLNSLTVGQVVVEAAQRLGLSPPAAPTDYADATIAEVADALGRLSTDRSGQSTYDHHRFPAGVDEWVRAFTFELIERPLSRRQNGGTPGECVVVAPPGHPLAEPLGIALRQSPLGDVVAVCLPPGPNESHVDLLLQAAHAALANRGESRFVVVQHNGGGAGFAKTLHLESPKITVCVVDLPLGHSKSIDWIVAETTVSIGYHEAHYDASGRRSEPSLQLLPLDQETGDSPLDKTDVVLVTGGGKGIAAECALALAQTTGVRLALMGRSDPENDRDLAANLAWMSNHGVSFRYVAADVTDGRAVERAVGEIQSELGPITALLHGAGTNNPQVIGLLDREHFLRTLAPKVQGVANVLAAIDPDRLRVLVTFGSIIARIGLPGEADYATANEWLTMQTRRWCEQHPQCRCLAVEWSIWSDVAMGQRLDRVEAMRQRGVTPITAQQGTRLLLRLLSKPLAHTSVVVTGRFGDPPTLKVNGPELPLLRFLERPLINYPNVELVVEAELSTSADPYLNDHVFRGQRLLPAVIGLEAMAQTAMALGDRDTPPTFEAVQFNRSVLVPEDGHVTIRIAALMHPSGSVDVALRSSETAFQTDHFNATCRFEDQSSLRESGEPIPSQRLELNPQRDLYGGLLFHEGRFRRLVGYRHLQATACVAELSTPGDSSWFGQLHDETLVLGDPSIRDATIHAIQACIPHRTLLPIGADRIKIGRAPSSGPLFVQAQERSCDGTTFVYDVVVRDAHGLAFERWTGLQLRAVEDAALPEVWAPSLLGAYLERRIHELLPGAAAKVVLRRAAGVERRTASMRAIQDANGHRGCVHNRPDGKPRASEACEVSASHAGDLVIAVSAPTATGCDLEPVVSRPRAVWEDLLGSERFALAELIAQEAGECSQKAATRVWTAIECLKKAGAAPDAPLLLDASIGDGWVVLSAGRSSIATLATTVRDAPSPLVIAVLVTPGDGLVRGGMQRQHRTETVSDALAT